MLRKTPWLLALAACATTTTLPGTVPVLTADTGGATTAPTSPPTGPTTPSTTPPTPTASTDCSPVGAPFCPIVVDAFPYADQRSTADSDFTYVDAYACAPSTDESGSEWWYRVDVPEAGLLTAAIDEIDGDGIDVDVHLLDAPDPDACLDRDHAAVTAWVDAGSYYVVIDTFVSGGVPQDGPYTLDIQFSAGSGGDCALVPTDVEMFWSSCAVPDCFTSGGDVFLATPTTGPVVKEAHLVTVDDAFGGGWPTSFTDGIDAHYALSEAATGYAMDRREPWAPAGEGGSRYGQAAYYVPLPVEDEAWYVNMYWRQRPAPGTRMLLSANGRTVVAAAGYETGPGSNTAVAGASEEIHHYLGTSHLSEITLGFAADQALPLGPIDCD